MRERYEHPPAAAAAAVAVAAAAVAAAAIAAAAVAAAGASTKAREGTQRHEGPHPAARGGPRGPYTEKGRGGRGGP